MSQSFFNFGLNLATWVAFGIALVTIIFAYFFIKAVINLFRVYKADISEEVVQVVRKTAIRNAVITAFFLVICIIFFYFGFGSGRPTYIPSVQEDGMRSLINKMPEEKSQEEIREEAYQKKPKELKRQDDAEFEKEKKEADEYIRKALEKAKTNN